MVDPPAEFAFCVAVGAVVWLLVEDEVVVTVNGGNPPPP